MENLSLLLSCSRADFYRVVKHDRVKCDSLDEFLHCTILYSDDYRCLVNDARYHNRQSDDSIWFVYITQKF